MEWISKINNPIDDPIVIDKLINAYANSFGGIGGFYSKLTKTVSKNYNKGQYYEADSDKFYSMLFNKWKNSIVSITKDEFVELYKKGSYGKDFIKMRNYLMTVPDVSTKAEANNVFFGNKNDKELAAALDKYRWSSLGAGSGWIHVCSRDLTAKKDSSPKIEHRLYIDTESLDTYKIITYFIEKCDKYHLPYYFKFDQYGNRDDTIVIYASSELLNDYIDILQEIKREHSELISRVKEPPLLTGRIDEWIGYGSEPKKAPDGKNRSFNDVRSKLIEPIIEASTKKWVKDHINMQLTYRGQQIRFKNYLAIKAVEALIENLEKRYYNYDKSEKEKAQLNNSSYNPQNVSNKLGFTLQDLKSSSFKENMYNVLMANFDSLLSSALYESDEEMYFLPIDVRNGKRITFSGYDLEKVIQSLSGKIAKIDANLVSVVRAQIKNSALQYGVDPNAFCFDVGVKNKIENIKGKNTIDYDAFEKKGISKQIIDFLVNNGMNLNNLFSIFNSNMKGINDARRNDYDYTLTWGNIIYKNNIQQLVYIKDIVGSFGLDSSMDLLPCVSLFYNEKDGYGQRSLNNLKVDIMSNVDAILNSNVPLKLIEIDGKYYVGQDGNHRVFYLILAYLILKEKFKNDSEMLTRIEQKFAINAEVRKKSGYDKIDKICYCLSKCWNDDIKVSFNNENGGIALLQIGDNKYEINEESDFIECFNNYLLSLDKNSKKYMDLDSQLSRVGYPNRFVRVVENKKAKNNIDISNLTVDTIIEIINPVLLKKNLKLPNGMEISAKQYIQDIVFPFLPKNGVVILSNGSMMPVKQFIEECVICECQKDYNGDFLKYMAEKTRNNMGVISLDYYNERYEINPVNVTDYIGQEFLDRKVKLPNGIYISAMQYIQEIFAPYIPRNGRIVLSNGTEISVIQYIEEVLLYEGQNKYNGDIIQIISNTTRNNVGVINADPVQVEKSIINMCNQQRLKTEKMLNYL